MMFWRKEPEPQASAPAPSARPNDVQASDSARAPEELEYQEQHEEKLLQAEHDEDHLAP
jgi:hypothetical protein